MERKNEIKIEIKPNLFVVPKLLFSEFINFSTYSLIEFIKKEAEENPFIEFEFEEDKLGITAEKSDILDDLIYQLHMLELPEKIMKIGEFIIMNLEEDGYFKMDLKEVAEILNVDYKEVLEALEKVQSLEPVGIGSRSLKECLLIQAKRILKDDLLIRIIEKHWDLLLKRKFKEIGEKVGIKEEKIKTIIDKLKKLNPYPLNFKNQFLKKIVPEGKIIKEGKDFKVYLEDKILPFLKIDMMYKKYLNSPLISLKEKKFLEKKIERARLIMNLVEKRRKFLQDVFQEIIDHQKDFFIKGNLYPLKEEDIAKKMGVSVSTISRAINGKYLISPKGLLKIKDLFVPQFKYSISKQFVLEKIKEIIKNEKKPISDKQIAIKLGYFGIKISRRTVNKYRNQIKILNSYLR
ncbi:MAG: RNA polymerase factor sigma-54 [Candidatus Ratteibacteria bacterium]